MARGAIINDTIVREIGRQESSRKVTHATILRRRHMIRRLADRGIAMACGAIAGNTRMIELGAGECGGVMTNLAIFRGRNMRRIRFRVFTDGANAMT